MYGNININVEVEGQEVADKLSEQGFFIVTTTAEAIDFILKDSAESRLLYEEKENIKYFLEQEKYKNIPNAELVQFLNKY